jgi:aspartate kinase
MRRLPELRDTLLAAERNGIRYRRIFVVSAFGGITDLLLEHKKSGAPGVYASFADDEDDHGWLDALSKVATAMEEAQRAVLDHPGDIAAAGDFVRDRIEGARSCLFDLQRLNSYGHFRLTEQLQVVRELLAGLGEAHSAFVASLMLQRVGVNARFVDLSGWRDEADISLEDRIKTGLSDVDLETEMPIVTGYAQCREGLMDEFDRGYSEVTFSRIAALTDAREAIIHKEFHLSSADPKLVGEVVKLGRTNYDVADQLANLGMEAIHPKAAKTLRRAEIPLRVTNAFEPDDPGTLIDDRPADAPGVEIVTGLDVTAIELFEPDMVGVKGYDTAVLEALTRHKVRIVSKTSNANTIVHYVETSLKAARRVEHDLKQRFPSAIVTLRKLALVSAVGRDLSRLATLRRGLEALERANVDVVAAMHGMRGVDTQFLVERDAKDTGIRALHDELVLPQVAQPTKKAA